MTDRSTQHSYVMVGVSVAHERHRARMRLLVGFPQPTLIHHHPADSLKCPVGSKHEQYRLDGRVVTYTHREDQ